jgi:NAD(P)-dependent dehydrogenase (short-subunit alcohol dehydrogenase family)
MTVHPDLRLAWSPGRRALVTGGASGLGLGLVERLAAVGARVVALDVDATALSALAARFPAGEVRTAQVDVTDDAAVDAAVAAAVTELGGLDLLVNSAGVFAFRSIEATDPALWDRILDVNLRGTYLVLRAAIPALKASGHAAVVNIASDAGKRGYPLLAAYCASKFGVVGLTQAVAAEVAGDGVRVNAVCPATVAETGMGAQVAREKVELGWGRDVAEVLERGAASFPLGRVGTVDDVVEATMFLLSDSAAWITGEALNVDGGEMAG